MRLCDWRYGARTVSGAENVAPGYFKVDTPVATDHIQYPTQGPHPATTPTGHTH